MGFLVLPLLQSGKGYWSHCPSPAVDYWSRCPTTHFPHTHTATKELASPNSHAPNPYPHAAFLPNPHNGLRSDVLPTFERLSVILFVGTPLWPYGIAYRTVNGSSTSGSFKKFPCWTNFAAGDNYSGRQIIRGRLFFFQNLALRSFGFFCSPNIGTENYCTNALLFLVRPNYVVSFVARL